jgi:hypothetical protein
LKTRGGQVLTQTDQKLLGIRYTLIVSEGSDFSRKIIEKESRLELTQLQFQFLAKETPNGEDYLGFFALSTARQT